MSRSYKFKFQTTKGICNYTNLNNEKKGKWGKAVSFRSWSLLRLCSFRKHINSDCRNSMNLEAEEH